MTKDRSTRIKLSDKHAPILKNRGMNQGVFRQAPYQMVPTTFVAQIPGLKPRTFSRQKQIDMFEAFLADPFEPINYCVVSAPDDGRAKLLAAYMMQHCLKHHNSHTALPMWVDLVAGFDNPLVVHKSKPSMLVINNVGTDSTNPKMEKLRDILEVYASIPRVVIAHGCDPYTFFKQYLALPIHGLAYITNASMKKSIDL